MAIQIKLTQGKVALVDDEDFEYLSQWKYSAVKKRGRWYAVRMTSRSVGRKVIPMHNDIIQPPPGFEVDHIDLDGLNNQKSNLRLSTHIQNSANRGRRSDNTSGYKGVSKYWNKWKAQVFVDGRCVFVKSYPTAEEAAHAYDEAAKKYFGEYARLNFPE